MNTTLKNTLLWIVTPIASIMGSLIMTVIANMIIMMHGYSTTEISCSGDVLEPIFQVFEFAMRDWVTGAAFVSVGVAVAPYSKRIVSIVLSTSFVSLSIVGTVFIRLLMALYGLLLYLPYLLVVGLLSLHIYATRNIHLNI